MDEQKQRQQGGREEVKVLDDWWPPKMFGRKGTAAATAGDMARPVAIIKGRRIKSQ
jgi:hypothetical protein